MNEHELTQLLRADGGSLAAVIGEDPMARAAGDALDSFLLAMRAEGIDVASPAMVRAIQTTLDALANNLAEPEESGPAFTHPQLAMLRAGLAAYKDLALPKAPTATVEDLKERATDCGRVRGLDLDQIEHLDAALCQAMARAAQETEGTSTFREQRTSGREGPVPGGQR